MSDAYPKIMTRGGEEISVGGAAEEAVQRAAGWCSPLDDAGETRVNWFPERVESGDVGSIESVLDPSLPDDEPEGPTFGPPHDQTHRKRASKKR